MYCLLKNSIAVITDSGDVQEESTYLGIPCITLRDNTERYETVTERTNELIGTNPELLHGISETLNKGKLKSGCIPELWDGKSSERIINHLIQIINE